MHICCRSKRAQAPPNLPVNAEHIPEHIPEQNAPQPASHGLTFPVHQELHAAPQISPIAIEHTISHIGFSATTAHKIKHMVALDIPQMSPHVAVHPSPLICSV
ncbi:hypothetical protein DRP05_00420 [Archaeoglobales archaeon]|nr:MAG: hypothetical protein DRP05_00420 [Archaeoglobales archaeon]